MSLRCQRVPSPGLAFALFALLSAPSALALEPEPRVNVDPWFGPHIAASVVEAATLLDERPCALVLSDFVDSRTGRTLAENLARTGRTASEHVRSLRFRGSPSFRPFPGRRVFAYTTPSSSEVFFGRQDLMLIRNQRRLVTAIVIHEVLHTLGLREDAPTSVSITERVIDRCF